MRTWFVLVVIISLIGCGGSDADNGSTSSGSSMVNGSFEVSDSFGGGFNSSSERARIGWANPDAVDIRAQGWRLSVMANRIEDEGPIETTDLNRNNTRYTMTLEENGASRQVNCLPADPVQGRFERAEITETTISGRFEVTFVQCEDRMGEPTEVEGLPITVSGEFTDLELTQP